LAIILASIIGSPLLAIGQTIDGLANGLQRIKNLSAGEKLEFLQYCILIYKFLNSRGAIVKSNEDKP